MNINTLKIIVIRLTTFQSNIIVKNFRHFFLEIEELMTKNKEWLGHLAIAI